MASITWQSGGRKMIQFVGTDKRRHSIHLGKVPMSAAQTVKIRVEAIVGAKLAGSPLDGETAEWVGKLKDRMHAKLAAVQLVEPRKPTDPENSGNAGAGSLKWLLGQFNSAKLKVKKSTRVSWGHTQRNLIEFFGESKDIGSITEADAEKWAEWIEADQELSQPTAHKRCGNAKQFFAFAKKSRLIDSNPFAGLKSGNLANRGRDYFLSPEDARRVIDACPDGEWRLLFALSRYGGLRCPSEHLSLRWDNVDLPAAKMRVISPKTEHHQGGASRMVPIFPELRPFLQEAWDQAEDRAEWVIVKRRDSSTNLRTTMMKIIKRAGLEPWPKLFHNLRGTRQTELEESFPSHVVCAWLGNSEKVARKHYLQTTEDHFDRAAIEVTSKALQKALHHTAKPQNMPQHGERDGDEKTHEITANAAISGVLENSTSGRDRTRTCDLHDVNVAI